MSANRFILSLGVSYGNHKHSVPKKMKTAVTSGVLTSEGHLYEVASRLKEEIDMMTIEDWERWIKMIDINASEKDHEEWITKFNS